MSKWGWVPKEFQTLCLPQELLAWRGGGLQNIDVFDSTLSSRNVVPHPSGASYGKVGVFDSTLSSRKVVPHPSGAIYKKVDIFDSTLSSWNVVPHPSGMPEVGVFE